MGSIWDLQVIIWSKFKSFYIFSLVLNHIRLWDCVFEGLWDTEKWVWFFMIHFMVGLFIGIKIWEFSLLVCWKRIILGRQTTVILVMEFQKLIQTRIVIGTQWHQPIYTWVGYIMHFVIKMKERKNESRGKFKFL